MAELFKGLERIEEARERLTGASFMAGLFVGQPDFALLLPPPEPPDERTAGEAFCRKVEAFLKSHVDPEEIERTAKIPEAVLKGLFELGAFGMKIPKEYGGLGFSFTNYGRVLTLIASWSNTLSLTVAVPSPSASPCRSSSSAMRRKNGPTSRAWPGRRSPPSRSRSRSRAPTPPTSRPKRCWTDPARTSSSTGRSSGARTGPSRATSP